MEGNLIDVEKIPSQSFLGLSSLNPLRSSLNPCAARSVIASLQGQFCSLFYGVTLNTKHPSTEDPSGASSEQGSFDAENSEVGQRNRLIQLIPRLSVHFVFYFPTYMLSWVISEIKCYHKDIPRMKWIEIPLVQFQQFRDFTNITFFNDHSPRKKL